MNCVSILNQVIQCVYQIYFASSFQIPLKVAIALVLFDYSKVAFPPQICENTCSLKITHSNFCSQGGVKTLRPATPQIVYRPQLNKGTVNQTKALLTKPQMLPTTVTSMQMLTQQAKSPAVTAQHREKRKYEALK